MLVTILILISTKTNEIFYTDNVFKTKTKCEAYKTYKLIEPEDINFKYSCITFKEYK